MVITFNGWAQFNNHLYLTNIYNCQNLQSFPIDYLSLNLIFKENIVNSSLDKIKSHYSNLFKKTDIAIGWSLGAKLLLLLTIKKYINLKYLILISPPFFIENDFDNPYFSKQIKDSNIFYEQFRKYPQKTLKFFARQASLNDKNYSKISYEIILNNNDLIEQKYKSNPDIYQKLLNWLKLLNIAYESKDFEKLDNMPKILIIQGENDKIINMQQAVKLQKILPKSKIFTLNNCGHAPHIEHAEIVKNLCLDFLQDNI